MEIDPESLAEMPLHEADKAAQEQIEHHRTEMARWRKARASRIATERAQGRSIADLMSDLGVSRDIVQRLLRAAKETS
jgi:uncharacterized protein YbcI